MEAQHKHKRSKKTSSTMTAKGFPRNYVVHDYVDHGAIFPSRKEEEQASPPSTVPFPVRLHRVLEHADNPIDGRETYAHIMSWQPHGRCFVVHQPQEFITQIMPRFFPHITKLASFQRQLNLYGFQRITHGIDRRAYYHERFLRGKEFLAHGVNRTKVKGTRVKACTNPAQEPNFYDMVRV